MRILQASTAHPLTDNRITYKHAVALAEAGHEVHVAGRPPAPSLDPLTFHEMPSAGSRAARARRGSQRLWRLVRRLRPDVIQLHDPELIPLGLALRAATSTKVVFDLHEDLPAQIMTKQHVPALVRAPLSIASRALLGVASRCLHAVVIAEPTYAPLTAGGKVWLVQNFPWLRDYPEPSSGSSGGDFALVYVGAISRARGVEVMIRSAREAGDRTHLTLAGPTEAKAAQILGDAHHPGLTYLGLLRPSSIPDLLSTSAAGLVVLHPIPNYLRSQPTKLFEYMASGIPFIASDFDYWRELVGDGCGIWVDPESESSVTAAIRTLADDPASARDMGRRGRSLVEQKFNYETEAVALLDMVRSLADPADRSGRKLRSA